MRWNSQTAKGFTLVEVLVAISVSALLIALAYGSVLIGQRSANTLFLEAEKFETMQTGWHFLADALRRAIPFASEQETEEMTGFQGADDGVSFVADLPAGAIPGGPTKLALTVEEQEGQRQLILRLAPALYGDQSCMRPCGHEATLVERLDKIEIEYLGKEESEVSWHKEWKEQDYLPNLVRIRVFPYGERPWPVLMAHPRRGAQSIRVGTELEDVLNDTMAEP